MKHRFMLSLCGVAAATAIVLSACSSSGNKSVSFAAAASSEAYYGDYDMAYDEYEAVEAAAAPQETSQMVNAKPIPNTPGDGPAPATGGGFADVASPTAMSADGSPLDQRKIIRHSSLSLETTEFDQAIQQIIDLVNANGGYIESQNVDGKSLDARDEYYSRYASISARIPSEKLDTVTSGVGGICNIVSQSESMDDITDYYFDAQAHLDTLNVQEERLLEILTKAEKLEDVVQLEQALSDTRYQIESLTASLRRMDSQVTYSYLNMDLREVVEYKPVTGAPKTFAERLGISAQRGGTHLVNFSQNLLLTVVEIGPLLVLLAVAALIVLLVIRLLSRARKRRAEKKAAPAQAAPETTEPKE